MGIEPKVLDRRLVPKGVTLFREGDEGNAAYLVKSGSVEISTVRDGKKVVLTVIGNNQIFGELALIDGAPRSATAVTLEDCEVVLVSRQMLEKQIEKLDGFMQYWVRYLTTRIRELSSRVQK